MSLDPEDWDAYRAAAHRLLDACIDRLESASDHPWQPVPPGLPDRYRVTGAGTDPATLADRLARDVLPYGTGNTHPRFWGWVHGTGLAEGLMSEMVTATMNANLGGRDHGAVQIERAVIEWAKSALGFPAGASGVLVAGTSQATVLALQVARVRAEPDLRKVGGASLRHTVYCGAGAHNAIAKAVELLGIGRDALRRVAEDEGGMDLATLREAIAADRAAGLSPLAVVGTAGSVDLGRFDDLRALADIARDEGLWLHVDAAFGAWTRLADAPWRHLSDGIEKADSLACDFHKWMFVPYDCGLCLIADEGAHRAAFAARPAYLAAQDGGLGGGDPWFCDYGIDLSRGNRALKVWAALEGVGSDRLGAAITRCCALAARMGDRVTEAPRMALAAPVMSNLCVFTADSVGPPQAQSELNRAIARDLQESGTAVFSTTDIGGITCLRAAITNHRTVEADVDAALAAVAEARDRLA